MSISNLLLLAYIVIWVPTFFICWSTYQSLQLHTQQMQQFSERHAQLAGDVKTQGIGAPLLQRAARKWRTRASDYQPQAPMIEFLLDLQLAFLSSIAIIFLFGTIVVWLLKRQLSKPIERINESILNLTGGKLVEPINISGLKNVVAIGDQLEKLRLHMNESEKLQVHFLRHISHEIKTPLTSI